MKDPKQVLQQKEAELARVRKEIDSLNTVAPLLADDDRTSPDDPPRIRDRTHTGSLEQEALEFRDRDNFSAI